MNSIDGQTPVVKQTELTGEQLQQWGDTTSMMAWVAPGFRHIWYRMLSASHNDGRCKHVAVMSKDVSVAATDGRNLIINPDTFFKYQLPERVFIAAHEVCHNMYNDVNLLHACAASGRVPMNDGTSLPFDDMTMQRVMDMRINALLIKSKIGKCPKDATLDPEADGTESVLDLYKKHYDGQDNDGKGPGGFDKLLPPGASTGQNPGQAAGQRNPQQWAIEIAAAQTIEQMRSQGKMSAALQRMFQQLLEPEVDWREHIQTIINRIGGSGGWNWKEPDEWWSPHDFFQPRKTGKGAGWIVIWGDTSGSRGDDEIASNIAELAGMIEDVNPARLTVLWCDASIHYVDEIADAADLAHIQARGVKGGGGTSVHPVFAWMEENGEKPDLFIGFTDGYVDFPPEPRCPVVWASSTDHQYPYGEVVRVNKRGAR